MGGLTCSKHAVCMGEVNRWLNTFPEDYLASIFC